MEKHPLLSWRFHCSAWSFVQVANYFPVSSLSQWAILSQIQSGGACWPGASERQKPSRRKFRQSKEGSVNLNSVFRYWIPSSIYQSGPASPFHLQHCLATELLMMGDAKAIYAKFMQACQLDCEESLALLMRCIS